MSQVSTGVGVSVGTAAAGKTEGAVPHATRGSTKAKGKGAAAGKPKHGALRDVTNDSSSGVGAGSNAGRGKGKAKSVKNVSRNPNLRASGTALRTHHAPNGTPVGGRCIL